MEKQNNKLCISIYLNNKHFHADFDVLSKGHFKRILEDLYNNLKDELKQSLKKLGEKE